MLRTGGEVSSHLDRTGAAAYLLDSRASSNSRRRRALAPWWISRFPQAGNCCCFSGDRDRCARGRLGSQVQRVAEWPRGKIRGAPVIVSVWLIVGVGYRSAVCGLRSACRRPGCVGDMDLSRMLDSLFDLRPQVVFIDDTGRRQKRPWRRASAGVLMCRSSNRYQVDFQAING